MKDWTLWNAFFQKHFEMLKYCTVLRELAWISILEMDTLHRQGPSRFGLGLGPAERDQRFSLLCPVWMAQGCCKPSADGGDWWITVHLACQMQVTRNKNECSGFHFDLMKAIVLCSLLLGIKCVIWTEPARIPITEECLNVSISVTQGLKVEAMHVQFQ